ncbi:MAG: hypothetical protein K6G19_10155 [Lachnospiraceae bacterium]|nr:hypothetical protein [Lachnospiraceae bacterium]
MPKTTEKKEVRDRVFLILYLLVFILAALSIALIQPLKDTQGFFNPPDEEARFLVPQYICEHGTIPTGSEEEVQIRGYGGSYAFYTAFPYVVMGFFMRGVSLVTDSPLVLLYSARLVNVAAGLLCAFVVYLLGGLLFQDKRFAWLFRIAVMFLPQHLFLYTYVNNDAFSLLGVALILYSFVRMYRWQDAGISMYNVSDSGSNGTSKESATESVYRKTVLSFIITLGLGISLCTLSYYNSYGYVLISVPLFVGLFVNKKDGKLSFEIKTFFKYAVLETALVLLLAGWWFIRSYIVLDGDVLGLDTMSKAQEQMTLTTSIVGRKPPLAEGISVAQFVADPFIWASLVFSYIGQYGCTSIIANKLFYFAYMLYMFIGFVQGIIMVHKSRGKRLLLEICAIAAALISFSLWFIYCYTTDLQTQGRYIMMTVTTMMYFIVRGYEVIINSLSKKLKANESKGKKAAIMAGIILAFILLAFFSYTYLIAYPCYLQFPVWSQM